MSELPKCKLCGADAAMHKVFGGIKYCCSSETCTMHDVLMLKSQWRTLMTKQAGDSTDQLRFKSACEISGEKHPEYVRGYEAAMDAVCKAQPATIPTSEVYLSGAEADVLYKLFFFGPQNDGDLPSKSGMCGLISKGFAEKRYDTKYEQEPNILTMQGFLFARSRYGYDNTTMPPAPGGEG